MARDGLILSNKGSPMNTSTGDPSVISEGCEKAIVFNGAIDLYVFIHVSLE